METLIAKVGMEIETSRDRFGLSDYQPVPIKRFIKENYIIDLYNENNTIAELRIKPVKFRNIKNTIRRYLILTDWFASDFEYYPGLYDDKAESNHLHISFKQDVNDIGFINSLLFLIPFMSRQNIGFRDALDDRASIHKIKLLFYDSKITWITKKESNHIEIRANENPFPAYIFIIEYLFFKSLSVSDRKFLDGLNYLLSMRWSKAVKRFIEENKDVFRIFAYYVFESEYNIYDYYRDLYKANAITNIALVMMILKEYEKYFKAPFTDFNKYLFEKVKKRFINDERFKEYENSDVIEIE